VLESVRPSTISYHIAKRLLERHFREAGEGIPVHLMPDATSIARRWMDEGHLVVKGVPKAAITYQLLADEAAERIYLACQRAMQGKNRIKAVLDPFNPSGSSRFVNFATSKPVYFTDASKCHVNAVVLDSGWEASSRGASSETRMSSPTSRITACSSRFPIATARWRGNICPTSSCASPPGATI
jgi:type III restriction enzyme